MRPVPRRSTSASATSCASQAGTARMPIRAPTVPGSPPAIVEMSWTVSRRIVVPTIAGFLVEDRGDAEAVERQPG